MNEPARNIYENFKMFNIWRNWEMESYLVFMDQQNKLWGNGDSANSINYENLNGFLHRKKILNSHRYTKYSQMANAIQK